MENKAVKCNWRKIEEGYLKINFLMCPPFIFNGETFCGYSASYQGNYGVNLYGRDDDLLGCEWETESEMRAAIDQLKANQPLTLDFVKSLGFEY